MITLWDIKNTKKITKKFEFPMEEQHQITAFDYNKKSKEFCYADSKDKIINIYDLEKQKLKNELISGFDKNGKIIQHSNRIFGLKYKYNDKNIILSGSWDDNLFIWDLRENNIIKSIYGPHITGQTIDIQNNKILSVSSRTEKCIEIYDFGTCKKLDYFR